MSEREAHLDAENAASPLQELSDRLAAAGVHAQVSLVGDSSLDARSRHVFDLDAEPVVFESESLVVRLTAPEYTDPQQSATIQEGESQLSR